jgi:DNA-binding transcriptional LysR family regulator
MPDRLESMRAFVHTVEKGSLVAAADALAISPGMVAKHIRFLERRLGEPLMLRTTRRQSLTEAGAVYYERCRRLIADADGADASVAMLRGSPRGRLKVHAPVSFGTERLSPALAAYMREHPDVSVELTLSDRRIDLVEQGYEAAVRIGDLKDARLIARPLRPYEMWLCASPDYLRSHGTPAAPRELAGHNCLAFAYWRSKDTWRFRRGEHHEEVRVSGRFVANSGQALRTAALAGSGVILQPEVLLAADVAAGRLVRLLPAWNVNTRAMHVVYAAGHRRNPKVKSFVDFMVATFG